VTTAAYKVRVSSRAKHPRLKMSAREGLVVVVPDGFDEARIPSLVEGKREWICRAEERLRDQVKFLVPQPPGLPPERISLRVVGQDWSVAYRQTEATGVTAVERRGQQLLVYGDIEKTSRVVDALRRWLARKTREHVVPWLTTLGSDRGLHVGGVTIRSQRTRWASCSAKGVVNLNMRLLFLPPELVRYALLHELAHIREMNHSRRYWALLESLEPNYRALDSDLRGGWRLVPEWIRPSALRPSPPTHRPASLSDHNRSAPRGNVEHPEVKSRSAAARQTKKATSLAMPHALA
jgi:predicted metal-dependent hydrolase